MLGDDAFDAHIAARCRGRHHIGARFDLIGNDGTGHAAEILAADNFNGIRTRAAHVDAHGIEHNGERHDVRFPRGVFDDGFAARARRRQHGVERGADRHLLHINDVAFQLFGHGCDTSRFRIGIGSIGAQSTKRPQMQIDGAFAEIATAGQIAFRFAEAAEQRSQIIIRTAQPVRQFLRHHVSVDAGGIDFRHAVFTVIVHRRAQSRQYIKRDGNIGNIGNVFDGAKFLCQYHRRQDRQHRIFSAVDMYRTNQGFAAANQIFFQKRSPFPIFSLNYYSTT